MKRLILSIMIIGIMITGCVSTGQQQTVDKVSLQQIIESTEKETGEMVDFLSKLIQYESVEDFGYTLTPDTRELMDFVIEKASGMGFSARKAADNMVVVLEYGEGEEVVGVMLHLDVVPVSGEEAPGWMYPPFSGEITPEAVWGRGSQDNKGSIAAVLGGAKILIDNGLLFRRKLRILMGTKEEKSFEAMTKYLEEEEQPDFGIVPDGIYHIGGEKGIADVDFSFPGDSFSAAGNQDYSVVYWHGGTVVNSVPDFSFIVVECNDVESSREELQDIIDQVTGELASGLSENFYGVTGPYEANLLLEDYRDFIEGKTFDEIVEGDLVIYSRGVSTSSIEPWNGKNAIIEVALAGALMDLPADNPYMRAFRFAATKIGLSFDGSGLTGEDGKGIPYTAPNLPPLSPFIPYTEKQYYGTSVNLGLVDSDSGAPVLSVNFRVGLENRSGEILEHSKYSASEFSGTAVFQEGVGSFYESFYLSGDDILQNLVRDCYYDVTGRDDTLVLISPGTTYMKIVKNFIILGPMSVSNYMFHAKDEHMPVSVLKENIAIAAHTLQEMLQMESPPPREVFPKK